MSEHQEIGDIQPTALGHLIGQQGVVLQVRVALEAAFADNRKFDHALLAGPPGCGKTQTAKIIAAEMAGEYHETLGQSIKHVSDLNELLLAAQNRDVVHIDEAAELEKTFQVALYRAIDERKLFLQGGKSKPTSIPIADFTLLLSTTDEYCLLQPLRDRMKLMLRFVFYTTDELTVMLAQRIHALGWVVSREVVPLIAQRARGTPRLALRLLQSCRRVCRSQGEKTIEQRHLETACLLEQIDGLGLGHVEQHYLRILADGPNRLNVIGSMLGLPARTVSQVTEPFLLRMGLVVKDDQGKRVLTEKGRDHLSKMSAEGA